MTHTHRLLQNILGTTSFLKQNAMSDSQLFRAYWVLGNVLHLMYMDVSNHLIKYALLFSRVSQVA